MEKLLRVRTLYHSTRLRSYGFFSSINNDHQELSHGHGGFRHYITIAPSSSSKRNFFSLLPHAVATTSLKRVSLGCRHPFLIGNIRSFCEDVSQFPIVRDRDIENVFKDLMATSWDDLPDTIIDNAKKALSKNTRDNAGREALASVFRAAEAVEEFGGILVTLRMEIDDIIGMSGLKIGPLPYEHEYALNEVYKRYEEYLDAFDPDEEYLQKKVETELGTKMTHLKMRCSFLDSEWGKVTVLGTSGLSGSYIEQRSP